MLRAHRRLGEMKLVEILRLDAQLLEQVRLLEPQVHQRHRQRAAITLGGQPHHFAQPSPVKQDRLGIRLLVQNQVRADRKSQS